MAISVNTNREAIQGGIGCCRVAMEELKRASQKLNGAYSQCTSGGWKDAKSKQLGDIVNECCAALEEPLGDLNDCMAKLSELLKAVEEYESTSL